MPFRGQPPVRPLSGSHDPDDIRMDEGQAVGIVTAQVIVGQFLQSFREFPPSQKSGSFDVGPGARRDPSRLPRRRKMMSTRTLDHEETARRYGAARRGPVRPEGLTGRRSCFRPSALVRSRGCCRWSFTAWAILVKVPQRAVGDLAGFGAGALCRRRRRSLPERQAPRDVAGRAMDHARRRHLHSRRALCRPQVRRRRRRQSCGVWWPGQL